MSWLSLWPSLLAVVTKEVRQTVRDRRMMFMLLFVPAVQLIVFVNAANLDVDRVPTVVVDQDRTRGSREQVRRLLADGTLREVARLESAEDAGREIIDGRASVALIIPEGFERRLVRGRPHEPAAVQLIVDGSDPNRSAVASSAVARYFAEVAIETLEARRAAWGVLAPVLARPVRIEPRVFYNPELETSIFMVPGIASMLLLLITTIVTAMGLAREKESGTLEQVLVTPVRPAVLLLGKLLPFAVIGLLDYIVAMVVGAYVFGMPIRGSVPLLLFGTSLYLVTTLSMGLLISTLSSTQQQAFLGGFLFMLPAALLSGINSPVRSMPAWLQPLTLINPLRHYTEFNRAVILRGASFADVAPQCLTLALFGVVLGVVAVLRFRKTTE